MNTSCFNLGIISAKKGKARENNPFVDEGDDEQKREWWHEGWDAAHSLEYRTKDTQILIEDKEVYEEAANLVE